MQDCIKVGSSTPQRLLALDFDGVLWDTQNECLSSACQIWQGLCGRRWRGTAEQFFAGRPLVSKGGEYGLLLKLIEEFPQRNFEFFPREEFVAAVHQEADFCQCFGQCLTNLRQAAIAAGPDPQWLQLQQPYSNWLPWWNRINDYYKSVVICTTKDEASVRALLAGFPESPKGLSIYGKSFSENKRLQLEKAAVDYDVNLEQIVFVDDVPANLRLVKTTGVRRVLAGWGYNRPSERAVLATEGVVTIDSPKELFITPCQGKDSLALSLS